MMLRQRVSAVLVALSTVAVVTAGAVAVPAHVTAGVDDTTTDDTTTDDTTTDDTVVVDDPTAIPQSNVDLAQSPDAIVDSWALTPEGADTSKRVDLSYTGAPGDVFTDEVTVWNLGNRQLTFELYATDAENTPDGSFTLLPGGVDPTDIGTWVTFEQERVSVPPGTLVTLPITIRIPDDARAGDHVGGVVASNTATDFNTVDETGAAINLERRTGSRLYIKVDGATRTELAVEDLDLDYSAAANPFGGSSTVSFRVQNRGNVRIDGTYDVAVAGLLGIGKQTSETVSFTELLPGQGIDVTIDFDGVPALGLASATVDLTPTGDASGADAVSSSTSAFAPPITLLLILLAAAVALVLRRRVRRRNAADAAEVVEFVPSGEHELV